MIHLLVARVAERMREFSIQSALGAGRKHLFMSILADMLLLMLPAGVLALAVAAAGFAAMRHYLGSMLARVSTSSGSDSARRRSACRNLLGRVPGRMVHRSG